MKQNSNNNKKQPIQLQEKHKKILVYSGLSFLFMGVMYLLFATGSSDKKALINENHGMNISIPEAAHTGLLDDKQSAYEKQQLEEEQARKKLEMATLSDLFQNTSDTLENKSNAFKSSNSAIGSSVTAYKSMHQTLDNFYMKDDTETKALQEEIESLKKQLNARDNPINNEDRQLALMEKSYQMAAKYLPTNAQGMTVSPLSGSTKKRHVKSVQQYKERIVSSLQESNWGNGQLFSTPVGTTPQIRRNTIKACIHQTMEITKGIDVPIRLLEPIQVANIVVPTQTILIATPKLEGNRLQLSIASIQYKGVLVPVALNVYALDGKEGISVPGTLEQNAVKEVLTSLGNASGNSFTLNNSASEQLLTDLGRGAIQGTSNYLKNKIQQTKITIKAGHDVLLLSEVQ
ncbi:conjugative transposon protein TraM [Tenacibaculum jejuense]|uniref:Conjugative transposon protein TraM n=2 Tax=Tenacibaculum jejuense TaxID=584609 RepID=A0A238U7R4_9FLAO|nr:Conjugative transposon protein TraM [Tenacibaculum jejuense]